MVLRSLEGENERLGLYICDLVELMIVLRERGGARTVLSLELYAEVRATHMTADYPQGCGYPSPYG